MKNHQRLFWIGFNLLLLALNLFFLVLEPNTITIFYTGVSIFALYMIKRFDNKG
jgi:hypothetical protein